MSDGERPRPGRRRDGSGGPPADLLGHPRLHLRLAGSTNARACELAARGAPHGTVVTAAQQSAGRGRQGRTWSAAPDRALLASVIVRDPPPLLSLAAGVAVAEAVQDAIGPTAGPPQGAGAVVKWPNDILVDGRKVAGILVEGRPQERWAVVGIGLNVALRSTDFPPELQATAGTLGLAPAAIEPTLSRVLTALGRWLVAPSARVLAALRERDALRGRIVGWSDGEGRASGIDDRGRLLVATEHGVRALEAGEVHLRVDARA